MKRILLAIIACIGILLVSASPHAQPAPSNMIGGWWGGSGCGVYTFVAPNGARTLMTDANGNLCVNVVVGGSGGSDPCVGSAKLTGNFSSGSSGGSIVTAAAGKRIYVCQVSVITSAAANVSFVEGTGSSVCTGGTTAGDWLNTGTTAANGAAFAANGGIASGAGNGTIFSTQTANQNLCLLFSTTNTPTVVASVTYVQQ